MGSNASEIAVGLLGYGAAGATFHAPLIAATPGLRLTHVGTSRPEAVRAALPGVATAPAERVLADPAVDLIVVATPNDSHAPLAAAALEAGKHVVVDKPLALDADAGRELAALAARRGRTLAAFQNRRWDSDFLTVRAALAADALGPIARFESRIDRYRPAVRDRWREADGPGAGMLLDLGPHLVDQALLLFGLPDDVLATIAEQRTGARSDDAFELVLRYGERLVLLGSSMLAAAPGPRFAMHGERGSLVKRGADVQEAQLRAGLRPGDAGFGVDPDPATIVDGASGASRAEPAIAGAQQTFYTALRDALRGAGPNPVPAMQAVGTLAVLDAARRSHATGSRIAPETSRAERAAWLPDDLDGG